MITIGITGQIGCGKSVVAAEFARQGALVLSGDEMGRQVVERNPSLLRALVARFGDGILRKNGQLDRRKLARVAFADGKAADSLNELVHPWLLRGLRQRIAQARRLRRWKVLVVDAALIYNWRLEQELDCTVVVESNYRNQRARLLARGLTESDIRNRIRRQIPKYVQRQRADFVLFNNDSEKELIARAGRLYRRITDLAKAV